jgi:type 1 glutamine amidotransferase
MKKILARITLLFAVVALVTGVSAADTRKKLVMLIAEAEYETAKTLPEFAKKYLEADYRVTIVSATPGTPDVKFDGIDALKDADVLLVSVRRQTPPKAQMDLIRRHVAEGKPVVGIRTASHAFALGKNQKLAEGNADWPEWDAQVLGGNYGNHHGKGPPIEMSVADGKHAIMRGVPATFSSQSTLYRNTPLRSGAHALLTGTIPNQPVEPIAWTFKRSDGGQSFYTSLGSPSDFQNPAFTQLLKNAIAWAASGKR